MRKPINCQTLVTTPIAAMTMAIPNDARKIIGFRPFLSASFPQYGETMADTQYMTAKTTSE